MEQMAARLPFWSLLTDREQETVRRSAVTRRYEKGALIHDGGSECLGMLLVLSGEIRTYLLSDEGREVTLYRLYPDDLCVLSASCVISQITFDTQICAQRETEVLIIPASIVAALGELAAAALLRTLHVPDDVFPQALLYLRIYLMGMPVILLYNFEAAIFRSVGETRVPLVALAMSGVLNVLLNLFFVAVLHMTVNGVAIATVMANAFSSALLFRRLLRSGKDIRLEPRKLRMDGRSLWMILRIGLPAGLQSAVFAISNIVIQSAINSLGKVVMAASSAAYNIEVFAYDVMNSYNQACTTFVGQNYGAGQIRRCRKTLYLCLIEDAVSLGATVALVLLTGRFLLSIFNNDPQVVALGYDRLKIVFFAYIFSLLYEVMSGYLRGFGISLVPAALTALGVCGIRIAWIHFVFPQHPTLQTIMTSYPVSLSATALMIFIALLCYRPARKHAAMEREPAPAGK